MLTPEQAAEMEALKAERAEVERIVRAPRRLGEIVARLSQLERAGERATARALADSAAPGWRERLAAAEQELAAATAEDDRLFAAAASKARATVFPPDYPEGSLPGRIGQVSPGLAGLIPAVGSDPPRAMAEMRRGIALRKAESLRSYPARLAAAKAAPPEADPAAEEAPRRRRNSWAMTTSMVGRVWALERRTLDALLRDTAAGAISAVQREPRGAIRPPTPGTAVLFVAGLLEYRQSVLSAILGSGTSTAELRGTIRALGTDKSVERVVLVVDSPGGSVEGIQELAATIRDVRRTKPVTALVDVTAGSAAYWVAASASEVIVSPSGSVGSVGVFGAHQDISKAARTGRRQGDARQRRQVQDRGLALRGAR